MWEMVRDEANSKCWIDLSDVVREKYKGRECYVWKNSIGCKIGVRYKWLRDEVEECWFEIVDYDKDTQKIMLKWNGDEYSIDTRNLQRGSFGNIFGKITSNFKYEIGQVVNGLTITDRYYKKDKKGRQ